MQKDRWLRIASGGVMSLDAEISPPPVNKEATSNVNNVS